MISEQIIKSDFITSVLERDVNNIFKSQLLIATRNIYITGKDLVRKTRKGSVLNQKSGALMDCLENPQYSISGAGSSFLVSVDIVKQLRFEDMKHLGNHRIYNAQVWGILYNNALPDIRSNVGEGTRDLLKEELDKAFESK